MKERLLLVLPTRSTFMAVDEEILSADFALKTLHLDQDRSRPAYLMRIAGACWFLLCHPACRKVAVWFADYHAAPLVLLAKLLRRRSYVFIGGYDAVRYPELDMGVYCSFWRGLCAGLALRNCTLIIANHPALLSSRNTYYRPQGHPDGVYRLLPGLRTPAAVIHNAPAALPESLSPVQRRPQILTVGTTPRRQDFLNKGYDLLTEIARRRPDLSFVFVGIRSEWLPALDAEFGISGLPNLRLIPSLPHADLLALMRESAVYCQPSISEGMPNALMEAMLMGCIPVGSDVAGIPTLIGKHGYLVRKRNSAELEAALDSALKSDLDRNTISKSIQENFSAAKRREALRSCLSQ